MTERLAETTARLEGIRQLGLIVNAMRGIAAARVQEAREQLASVDIYAGTIAAAIARAFALAAGPRPDAGSRPHRSALVVFCAEQGFAGAFSDRVLDAIAADALRSELFLIGTRGSAAAAERGLVPRWRSAMPAHSSGVPKLAERIADALYAHIATGEINRLDVVFSRPQRGRGIEVARQRLLPLDLTAFPPPPDGNAPLVNLDPRALLSNLADDYMHAQLCQAALHAFAAENEARMQAMTAAHSQVERQLTSLQSLQRRVRQEEITAEVLELAAGERASRPGAAGDPDHSGARVYDPSPGGV
ncbi:MAG TPA: FoF1 ATP synthase subunit gamma [Acidisphaera sp.]|nr:FoF1 ATP synthase subunit gamma [Acidisphaera sp.]